MEAFKVLTSGFEEVVTSTGGQQATQHMPCKKWVCVIQSALLISALLIVLYGVAVTVTAAAELTGERRCSSALLTPHFVAQSLNNID